MEYGIKHLFYLKDKNELDLLKQFVRTKTKDIRFVQNPYELSGGTICVHLGSDNVTEMNELSKYLGEFVGDDNN